MAERRFQFGAEDVQSLFGVIDDQHRQLDDITWPSARRGKRGAQIGKRPANLLPEIRIEAAMLILPALPAMKTSRTPDGTTPTWE